MVKIISSAEELVAVAELRHVGEASLGGKIDGADSEQRRDQVDVQVKVDVADDVLRTFLRIVINSEEAELASEQVAFWDAPERLQVESGALADFVRRVAFMTVYPFARASLSMTASRLAVSVPTLPLVRPSELPEIDPEQLLDGHPHVEFGNARTASAKE